LENPKKFHYQKHLGGLISQLDQLQQQAIENHIIEGTTGFVVPTNNMMFVFTANERLPYDDEVNGKKVRDKMIHLNAIRNRCRVYDFILDDEVQWGWISDVVLNTPAMNDTNISEDGKSLVCEFMYKNWQNMKTKSVRTAKMLCEDFVRYGNDAEFVWESEYLK